MILYLLLTLVKFSFRFILVGLLIKSSLEIILINKKTPQLIDERSQYFATYINQNLKFSNDLTSYLEIISVNKELISKCYGMVFLFISLMVLFNKKVFIKPLILLIFSSIVFFYVEFKKPYMIDSSRLNDLFILILIVGGLFILNYFGNSQWGTSLIKQRSKTLYGEEVKEKVQVS